MKFSSRLIVGLVAGCSLATCVVAHADSAAFRAGPKDTVVTNAATSPLTARNALAKSYSESRKQFFAAGPRNTIPAKESKQEVMLSREH